jgi:hypothetical protein
MVKRLVPFFVPCLLAVLVPFLVLVGSAQAAPSEHPFEIVPGSFQFTTGSGQAGAHSNWVTAFDFAHEETGSNAGSTYNDVRETVVELPAGFDASNTAVPTCSNAQLIHFVPTTRYRRLPDCPVASQIGQIELTLNVDGGYERVTYPLYNMEVSSFGVTAELGFNVGILTQILTVSVRPDDEGLTVTAPNIARLGEARDVQVTVWGVPAAAEHDAQRGEICVEGEEVQGRVQGKECHEELGGEAGAPQPANIPVKPFLSNPTSCGMFTARFKASSWEEAGVVEASDEVGPIGECERVPFEPSLEVQPTTRSAESATGLDVSLLVPQAWENPYSVSTANLQGTTVTLPEGVTVNPSAGSGLGACSPAQYASETSSSLPGEGCPAESKIGSIEIETPLLAEKIPGAIYIATPYDNPFGEPEHPGGSLLALYVVAKDPARGILIKVAGKITPNPVTGQLVTTFGATPAFGGFPATAGTPQQPFSRFTLKFRPGATAPLVSPAVCGSYAASGVLTPWSGSEPRLVSSLPFETSLGVHEGPCPSGGVPPFKPQVISGTSNNAAGSYSPFYLQIFRQDGEQELTRFSTTLPPGLTGNLTGIPFCSNGDIEASKHVSGAEEEANPSCPPASEIGHTIVSAGVGSVLAQTPGKIYLAGPYNGAPLSIVSITSAKVGPFDLGTVVIRFALDINPSTAQVEVSANGSDPIPHIIDGIVVHVREIRVYMSREKFILNPTSCTPMQISETIDGAGADPANPADQTPVNATAPFQAADCSSLKFEPKLTITTQGKTSKARGASLTAKLTIPNATGTQANISKVKVDLPKQLPSRLTTLQKACTAAQFNANPAGCPAASVIGYAKAITPILPVPIEGPAYFVSHGGEAFPSLEIVLQGYGITIVLTASTFISKQGITSSTFNTVPDQPVTSFELTLPEGPYSALAANGNLCNLTKTTTTKKKITVKVKGHKQTETRDVKQTKPTTLEMPTAFVGQNGAEKHESTPITVTGCAKARPAKKKAKKKAKKGKGAKKKK